MGATAPAGTGWKPTSNAFRYTNASRAPGGLRTVVLKAGYAGNARLVVKGGGPNLGLPPTLDDVGTPVTVQLWAANGACWDARYPTAATHTSKVFKARAASPAGAFLDE
ncbi:MAG TPA: hypothetical protein VKU61_05730 [Candidatus Binatia bacterium]|nr:hypothetical protein [Candidatus Binatia bacterium]